MESVKATPCNGSSLSVRRTSKQDLATLKEGDIQNLNPNPMLSCKLKNLLGYVKVRHNSAVVDAGPRLQYQSAAADALCLTLCTKFIIDFDSTVKRMYLGFNSLGKEAANLPVGDTWSQTIECLVNVLLMFSPK